MDQPEELMKLALFGSPVKSSLSPRIHGLFAGQAGLRIEYRCIEAHAGDFPDALEEFRLTGGTGCNVTLPIKREAWQLAVQSTPAVSQAQAANTLVLHSSGWFAHNTDGAGLVADLTVNHGIELENKRILIVGAGGAVAGILGDLLACDPREIMLVNRSPGRAWALVRQFSAIGCLSVTSLQDLPCLDLSEHDRFDLVINATSVGHHGEAPPLTRYLFAPDALCYDLNYFRASQPLKKYCQELRTPYIDGLGMLVEQAAKSFELWTGFTPRTKPVIENCRQLDPA